MSTSDPYFHHIWLWKFFPFKLKEVGEIRLGPQNRGQTWSPRLWRLFIWISNCEARKMWSLTKCDISGLMLLDWCVWNTAECVTSSAPKQISLANQDRCKKKRWWTLLQAWRFLCVLFLCFIYFHIINGNILTKCNKQRMSLWTKYAFMEKKKLDVISTQHLMTTVAKMNCFTV